MALPSRRPVEEDAWVETLMECELDRVEEAVRVALAGGRPRLAGRVVGLLPETVVARDPELQRAQNAAGLLMVERGEQLDALTAELTELFDLRRRRHMRRARNRSRERVAPTKPSGRRRKR
ncbi:MAG: hypothetical protein VX519_09015 [Myxococcota bacterium]|nr:hypothetical protein [Myxococcota bacterium]